MLKVFKTNTLSAILQVMRIVKYRKGQKQLRKVVPNLKNNSAKPPIYQLSYPELLSTASPGNQVRIAKPSLL